MKKMQTRLATRHYGSAISSQANPVIP